MHVTTLAFFSIESLEVKVFLHALLEVFEISYAAGKYLVYHKWSLESGESNAISFVYWECDNQMLYEKMRKRYN